MNEQLFDRSDFLKYLFDTVPSFLFVVDRDVRIFHLNSAASKLLRSGKEAVLLRRGGEVLRCIHSTETPEGCGRSAHCRDCVIRNSVDKAFRGESVHRETTKMELLYEGAVTDLYFMITARSLAYEGKEFVLLIMEDVTKLKRTEEELQRHAAQLEAANRELEAFSYSVSHDLKAPIRGICGFSDALMEDYAGRLDEEGRDYLTRIRTAGLRMAQLVDDLLNLSRAAQGELRREDVDLSMIAKTVCAEVIKTGPNCDIDFIVASGLRANCDGRLLRIVLENLIGNAVKFTSGRRSARVEFGSETRDGKRVYFVRDDGAGFDMALAAKLFSPFTRLHNADRFPGAGIGLATVRRVIHRHGGSIWAESAVDKGATFYFTL